MTGRIVSFFCVFFFCWAEQPTLLPLLGPALLQTLPPQNLQKKAFSHTKKGRKHRRNTKERVMVNFKKNTYRGGLGRWGVLPNTSPSVTHWGLGRDGELCCSRAPPVAGGNRAGGQRVVGAHSRGSSGAGIFWRVGSTPQISRAYWAMVRSLENLPEVPMFRITFFVHSLEFCGRPATEELREGRKIVFLFF